MALAAAPTLDRMAQTWRRSPLPAFLRWWGGELTALLPARLRDWVARGPEVIWLSVGAAAVDLRQVRTGALLATIPANIPLDAQRAVFVQACTGTDPDDRRLVLVVSASQVLHRRLLLPVAAASDPRRVVGYELDRQTPFKPEQVYYDVRVSRDPAPAGQVALDLYAAPKSEIDPVLERFAALGAHPDAVDVQGADGKLAGVDLIPPKQRPRRIDRRRRVNAILAAICVLLVVFILSQWLANRRAALATMQDEVDAMRAQATQSEQLRAQLTGAIAASKFLVKRKVDTPSTLALLGDLTTRLPGNAWLDALMLDDSGGLDMKGEAAKAAGLVDTLGSSKVLQEPKLQGVIQPDPATGKERFELVAHVRQAGSPDAH